MQLGRLADRVHALAEISRPHPLTTATAVGELKLYLPDTTKRIRMRDLVVNEANRIGDAISDPHFPVDASQQVDEAYARARAAQYEAIAETLVALMAVGSAWTEDPRPFVETLEAVANPSNASTGNSFLLHFQCYLAVLCLYAGGIAAMYAGRWDVLRALAYDPVVVEADRDLPAAAGLSQWSVVDDQEAVSGCRGWTDTFPRYPTTFSSSCETHYEKRSRSMAATRRRSTGSNIFSFS